MKISSLPIDAVLTAIPELYATPSGDIYSYRLSVNKSRPKRAGLPVIGKLTPHPTGPAKYQYMKCRYYSKTYSWHRLIAETFHPNPNNLPTINHIDENKFNNHSDNLEWMSRSDNSSHSVYKRYKPVIQLDLLGGFVKEHDSVTIAAKSMTSKPSGPGSIQRAASTANRTAYGYRWKYA